MQQRLGASLDEHLASSNDDAARRKREEAAAEAAREKRVEHLCGVAARRIGHLQLARGWSAWFVGPDPDPDPNPNPNPNPGPNPNP